MPRPRLKYDPKHNTFETYLALADGIEIEPVCFMPMQTTKAGAPVSGGGAFEALDNPGLPDDHPDIFAWAVYLHVSGDDYPDFVDEMGPMRNFADCQDKEDAEALVSVLEGILKARKPYDRDHASTFAIPVKCGGCGWMFDLVREGMDEATDPAFGAHDDRITLCDDCRVEE